MIKLYPHQLEVIRRLHNGCVLNGRTGSGKSIAAIAYYYICNGGSETALAKGEFKPMNKKPKDLYIITVAHKRDSFEWDLDLAHFKISREDKFYNHNVVIDSWNNIDKYNDVENAFFLFDEQRVVGYKKWATTFIEIAKKNDWILLSATPGDTWHDYISLFVANGFVKNKWQFEKYFCKFARYSKFPKVEEYLHEEYLEQWRNKILVDMEDLRETVQHHDSVYVEYNKNDYKRVVKDRWNVFEDRPIENVSELCFCLRKVVNSSEDRQVKLLELIEKYDRVIIFYNFNYELDILRDITGVLNRDVAEWNGKKHQPIPNSNRWVYLVQYTAGCEGWNCIKTNVIIFYSQNYSYKVMEQAIGRIDRINTLYKDLYYYHLKSRSGIDVSISKKIAEKKKFNEKEWEGKEY